MNLLLIIGLIILVVFAVSHFPSPLILTLIAIMALLVMRVFALEERLNTLEKRLTELLRRGSSPPSSEIKPTVSTPQASSSTPVTPTLVIKQAEHPPISATPHPLFIKAKNLLFSGNPMAKIGVLLLFLGMAFLINYVAQHNLFPIGLRLILVGTVGFVMVLIGCRLSSTPRQHYANILSGGGIGLLYLTIYAAYRVYSILPSGPTFLLLLTVVIASGMLAIIQDAKLLAMFGILGGFLAPILIHAKPDDYQSLFIYYLLLNVAIFSLGCFKSWRELNLVGFIFTFILSSLWGWQAYQPLWFMQTECFLAIFFLFYVAIVVVHAYHQIDTPNLMVDAILTFATPLVAFGLQAGIVWNLPNAIAWSAFGLSVFYALLTFILYQFTPLQQLARAFLGLAVLFATLTIPLACTGIWTATDWALESILILWFSQRSSDPRLRWSAALILLASTMSYVWTSWLTLPAATFINAYYLSGLFIVLAQFYSAYEFYKMGATKPLDRYCASAFILLAFLGWYYLNLTQIQYYIPGSSQFMTILLFVGSTSLVAWIGNEILHWPWLRYAALALLPALIVISLTDVPNAYHPLSIYLGWLFCFGALYSILYRHDNYPRPYLTWVHVVAYLFLTCFIIARINHELFLLSNQPLWPHLIIGIMSAVMLASIYFGVRFSRWPYVSHQAAYLHISGSILTASIVVWFATTNLLAGAITNHVYLPILNSIDLSIILAFLSMMLWLKLAYSWIKSMDQRQDQQSIWSLLCLLGFIWLNAMVCRSLHHWLGIPYDGSSLWHSTEVQASLAILWTCLALLEMFIAARKQIRALWFVGYALIWIVIIKLFLVDMSDTNTLARIITFTGVGLLLLINGYISPLPPKKLVKE